MDTFNTQVAQEEKDALNITYPTPTGYQGVGMKHDTGKPRWSLLTLGCSRALAGVVNVLTFAVTAIAQGGKGYLPNSWKEVPNAKERYTDALYRHLAAIAAGEVTDPESGELHWYHVATNALFLAELNSNDR